MLMHLSSFARSRHGTPALRLELARLWQGLRRACADRYRPERHYMRGPGPRWHEKHG